MKTYKESQVENINAMLKTCPFCGGEAEVVFAYNDRKISSASPLL